MSEEAAAEPVSTENVQVIESWRDSLPEEMRGNASLADIKDVNGLAQRFIDTKSMVGNSLRPPTGDAGQDDINSFNDKILANEHLGLMRKPTDDESMGAIYDSMGRPEDAGGYEAADGMDAEMFGGLANKAHELGLSKKQYEGLAQAQFEMQTAQNDGEIQERDQGINQLKGEWGDAYGDKVGRAAQMLDATNAPESLLAAVADGNVGADVLRWVDGLAAQLGGEGAPMASELNSINTNTVADLKQQEQEIFRRLTKENLTSGQKEELMNKRLALFEKIGKYAQG